MVVTLMSCGRAIVELKPNVSSLLLPIVFMPSLSPLCPFLVSLQLYC